MIVIIKFDLIDLSFIYVIIGLAHHILITVIQYIMMKKVNQDMKDTTYKSFGIILIDILFWPIVFFNRMIKYEEMSQTLKFVEDKLETFYKQEYDDEKE